MSINQRLYLVRIISSFGDWLTFIAIALLIKEQYGGDKVAFAFLIQSLGPLLLSNYVRRIVPHGKEYHVYIGTLLAASVNVLLLTLNLGLWQVYLYTALASVIGTFSRPLLMTLVGQWVIKSDLSTVHTRLGSLQASILAFAPPLRRVNNDLLWF